MNTPPFLTAAALLFWGWQAGLVPVAVVMAAVLEASRWVRFRLDLEQDHFNRLWNLTALIFIGTAMYVFFAKGGFGAVNDFFETSSIGVRSDSLKRVSSSAMIFVQWLPMVLFPFMVAQVYSHTRTLPWITFSLYYQARESRHRGTISRLRSNRVNPAYPFLMVVLLSASATTENRRWYFACVAVLLLWSLWPFRSRRFAPLSWASVFALAVLLALGFQFGLSHLYKRLELLQNQLMNQFGRAEFDTSQSRTAIGSIGRLKLSGKIVLRVSTDDPAPPPLLSEASFNLFSLSATDAIWTSTNRDFQLMIHTEENTGWTFNQHAAPRSSATVTRYSNNGEATFAMPHGPVLVNKLNAFAVETNRLGAARMIGALNLVSYNAYYGPDGGFAIPPEENDLSLTRLPDSDVAILNKIRDELALRSLPPARAVSALRQFFLRNFSYSTYQQAREQGSDLSPLGAFLTQHRTGHCEYFATATVLLLRAAGIPARYTVGYSVQERSGDDEWIVRERHAHAWAQAWIDGRWIEIDNTPADWNDIEAQRAGLWEPFYDWFSSLWLEFSRWRQGESQLRVVVFVIGVAVLGYMAWRQVRGKRWKRHQGREGSAEDIPLLGMDSEFFEVASVLEKHVAPRGSSESVHHWLQRLDRSRPRLLDQLSPLLELHYRLRFDPAGLEDSQRKTLTREARKWLETFEAERRSQPYKN